MSKPPLVDPISTQLPTEPSDNEDNEDIKDREDGYRGSSGRLINNNNPRRLRSAPPSLLSSRGSRYASPDAFGSGKSGKSIRVTMRVRPINENERAKGDINPCIVVEDSLVRVLSSQYLNAHQLTKEFQFFDSVVSADDNQDSAFEKFGLPHLLDDALAGTNVTLFAYGYVPALARLHSLACTRSPPVLTLPPLSSQTGSGKTYTIHGIIPRSLEYLFERLVDQDQYGTAPSDSIVCGISFCEIYNDSVYDLLLSSNRPLKLKWDSADGFHAPDIHIQPCNTLQDALAVLNLGTKRRRQRSHCLNAESSRSHAILTLYLFDRTTTTTTKSTKVHFVDLAGSERLKESGNANATYPLAIKETASINKSLFLLGNVICAIAANQPRHLIPYRDTKLTKMLFGSMIYPSKCLMIACCSPSEESLGTLDYASRLASADSVPVVHVAGDATLIASLKRENRLLKEEIRILRGG